MNLHLETTSYWTTVRGGHGMPCPYDRGITPCPYDRGITPCPYDRGITPCPYDRGITFSYRL